MSRTDSSPSSMRDSSIRSSIVLATRWASATIRSDTRRDDLDVVLVGQRLGEHREGADRRLQLVADVGDEVGAHRIDTPALADVLDRRHRRTAGQTLGRHDHGGLRRAVELEQLPRALTGEGPAQGRLHGVVDEQPGVRPGHRLGVGVAVQHLAARRPSPRPRGGCDRPPPTTSGPSVGTAGTGVGSPSSASPGGGGRGRRARDGRSIHVTAAATAAAPTATRTTIHVIRDRSPPAVRRSAPPHRTRGPTR